MYKNATKDNHSGQHNTMEHEATSISTTKHNTRGIENLRSLFNSGYKKAPERNVRKETRLQATTG